ncbi:unnamed protein product [Closterium sp. Yama58-4]|nr:unnamed protein product [Closterium sp. Yama58-4]
MHSTFPSRFLTLTRRLPSSSSHSPTFTWSPHHPPLPPFPPLRPPPFSRPSPSLSPFTSNLQDAGLTDAGLTGDLPAAVFQLTSLRSLNLALNPKLTGSLHDALGNLALLTLLDVHGCNLTGSIPATVGRLAGLKYFLLNQNGLSGSIPSTVSALQQLYMWDIMDNYIEGTVPSFVGASELVHLLVDGNCLTHPNISVPLSPPSNPPPNPPSNPPPNPPSNPPPNPPSNPPPNPSRITGHHRLVDGNRLRHQPHCHVRATNLTVIYWSNNVLPSLATTWFLPKLKDFHRCFGLIMRCIWCRVDGRAAAPSLCPLPPSHYSNLANNELSFFLPQEITTASQLQSLFLADNKMTGAIPDMSGLPNLVALSLFDNDFTAVPPRLLNQTKITLQLYGSELCKPFRAEIYQQCSPPRALRQFIAGPLCPALACASDLFRASQPLFRSTRECVCVSPLRADLGLYLTDLVVFSTELVRRLEEKLVSELAGRAHINITRNQVQVTSISSRAALASLASTFASDHTTHESTLIITALFFPPAGDDSWLPRDTPSAIRTALSTRDPSLRANLDEFGSYRVEAFYGPAPYTPPGQPASSGLSIGAIVGIAVGCATLVISLVLVLLLRPWKKRGEPAKREGEQVVSYSLRMSVINAVSLLRVEQCGLLCTKYVLEGGVERHCRAAHLLPSPPSPILTPPPFTPLHHLSPSLIHPTPPFTPLPYSSLFPSYPPPRSLAHSLLSHSPLLSHSSLSPIHPSSPFTPLPHSAVPPIHPPHSPPSPFTPSPIRPPPPSRHEQQGK